MTKLYGKDNPYKTPTVNERINRLGNELTVDDLIYGVMPDGKTNPDGWKTRMRARLAPKIKRRTGLADRDQNLNVLLREIMAELEEVDEIGNIKLAVGIMRRRTKDYIRQRANALADKQRQANEKAEINEYGRSLRMKDVHIAGVIAKILPGIDYAKRCRAALDQYRRDNPEHGAAQPGIYETGFVPDIAGATKIMEAYEASQRTAPPVAPVPSELDQWFGEKETKKVNDPKTDELNAKLNAIAAEQSGDELTALDDGYETIKENEAWASFWQSAANLSGLKGDQLHSRVHGFFNVGSVKVTGKNRGEMLTELKAHFDEIKNAPETPQIQSPAIGVHEMTNDATNAPNSSDKPVSVTALPEAPFSANFHLWDKHGIDIQFTIRADTVNEGCKKVDATIEQRLSMGYSTSRPTGASAQPTNITPLTQAPAPQSAPTGNKPVQSEQVVKVIREANAKSKVVYTGLYTMFGGAPGQYATYQIKDTDAQRLGKLNALTGLDWSQAPLFTERAVDITALFTDSDKLNGAGKPYHNLVDLQNSLAQSA